MKIVCLTIALLTAPQLQVNMPKQPSGAPRLLSGELLVGDSVPDRFLLTTAEQTLTLQEDPIGLGPSPNISADGSIVASTQRIPGDKSLAPRRIASTYSVKDRRWTDHTEFEGVLSLAISPDGSKLACVTRDRQLRILDRPNFRFRILDLKSGTITVIMESAQAPFDPSWSPDGHRLVFDMYPADATHPSEIRTIFVADLEDGTMSKVAIGQPLPGHPRESGLHSSAMFRDPITNRLGMLMQGRLTQ